MPQIATGVAIFKYIYDELRNNNITQNSIFILDEPEAHLHSIWQDHLANLLLLISFKLNIKLVVASHNDYFIDKLSYVFLKEGKSTKIIHLTSKDANQSGYTSEEIDVNDYRQVSSLFKELSAPKMRLLNDKMQITR